METYTVSLFGHRYLDNSFAVERELEKIICELLHRPEYINFLVGRNGDFDILATSVIKRCRRSIGGDNSTMTLVLPYTTAELRNDEKSLLDYYGEIEVCEAAAASHYKKSLQIRNRAMVDRSDLVIFCVAKSGGAYQTLQYAAKQGVNYINLLQTK